MKKIQFPKNFIINTAFVVLLLLLMCAIGLSATAIHLINQTQTNVQSFLESTQSQIDKIKQSSVEEKKTLETNEGMILQLEKNFIASASEYLKYTRNIPAAMMQLQQAQQLLLDQPKFSFLQQAINIDLENLSKANLYKQFDFSSVSARLYILQNKLNNLSFMLNQPSIKQETKPDLPPVSGWRAHLDSAWREIQQLIVVRHWKKPIDPLPGAQEMTYLKQNLYLLLEEAKWAVLQTDPVLYQQALTQFTALTTKFYDLKSEQTQDVLKEVDRLKEINIKPNMPELTASNTALKKI